MRGLHGTSLSISQSAGGGEGDIAQYGTQDRLYRHVFIISYSYIQYMYMYVFVVMHCSMHTVTKINRESAGSMVNFQRNFLGKHNNT